MLGDPVVSRASTISRWSLRVTTSLTDSISICALARWSESMSGEPRSIYSIDPVASFGEKSEVYTVLDQLESGAYV